MNGPIVNFSPTSSKSIRALLSRCSNLGLARSRSKLGLLVDFIVGKSGITYIDEHDMSQGKIGDFLPRILALRYETHYSQGEDVFKFEERLVIIHFCEDNTEKCITLSLFCAKHKIPTIYARKNEVAVDIIKEIAYSMHSMGSFIRIPSKPPTLDDHKTPSKWGGNDLNKSIINTVTTLPCPEKMRPKLVNEMKSIGGIANADKLTLKKCVGTRPSTSIFNFMRNCKKDME